MRHGTRTATTRRKPHRVTDVARAAVVLKAVPVMPGSFNVVNCDVSMAEVDPAGTEVSGGARRRPVDGAQHRTTAGGDRARRLSARTDSSR